VAVFDTPGAGIACALAMTAEASELGLSLRAGVHTGECDFVPGDLAGIAVHVAARVCDLAAPGSVFVTSTVKDLAMVVTLPSPRRARMCFVACRVGSGCRGNGTRVPDQVSPKRARRTSTRAGQARTTRARATQAPNPRSALSSPTTTRCGARRCGRSSNVRVASRSSGRPPMAPKP